MQKFRDSSMLSPTIVLVAICLVISAALAFTYQLTKPTIDAINEKTAAETRMEVLPDADSFTAYEGELPEGVTEYYFADNGAGVVITSQNKSFGGTITVMTGIGADGAITGVKVTAHSDTAGLGTKAQDAEYLANAYNGVTELDSVDNVKKDTVLSGRTDTPYITGATVSSNGIYGAVKYALAAYQEIGGAN